jgi:hypothetical protein
VTTVLPAHLSRFLSSLLMHCLDIRAVWSVGYAQAVPLPPARRHELLIFANGLTLRRLRGSDHLHRPDVRALVVFDGEQFESAWGPEPICGSLARWAWRQEGPELAYYSESRWAPAGEPGLVVRVRKKALLVWRSLAAPA